jgi:anti-sigma B factor antagonist
MNIAQLTVESRNSVIHVAIRGEVDLSNVGELRAKITDTTPNDALGLVLDLSDVTYLDSAGIGLLHSLRTDFAARGQKLELVIPPDSPITDALRLAGLDWGERASDTAAEARRVVEGA